MAVDLLSVLKSLDPFDETVWTDDGLPALDAVKALVGDSELTRDDINKVALGLLRDNVATYTAPPKASKKQKEVIEEIVPEAPLAVAVIPADDQDALQVELQAAHDELQGLLAQKQAIEAQILDLDSRHKALERQVIHKSDSEENALVIAEYVASAQRERDLKAEKIKQLEESGLSVKEILDIIKPPKRKRK
jgi:ribosomal silencing factor RsfS